MPVSQRQQVIVPPDLERALRERIRRTDGEDIAKASTTMLIRYAIARFAGIPQDEAVRYLRTLPRGTSSPGYPHARKTQKT